MSPTMKSRSNLGPITRLSSVGLSPWASVALMKSPRRVIHITLVGLHLPMRRDAWQGNHHRVSFRRLANVASGQSVDSPSCVGAYEGDEPHDQVGSAVRHFAYWVALVVGR